MGARIIERAGFSAVYLTGGGFSRSWGFPDMGLMTMTENVAFIARVCDSLEIPVIADGEAGYGNALNVVRTVREYERAGVAALHIEDQVTPKRCGHYEGKTVVSKGEMMQKIQAAVDTRRDSDLLIIARTDALNVLGYSEAIDRANAYSQAGADVVFVEAPGSLEQLQDIPTKVKAPVLIDMFKGGQTPFFSAGELERMGYKIVIFPNEIHRAAIWAMQECVKYLKDKGSTADFRYMVDWSTRDEIVGRAKWESIEQKYLKE